MSIQTEELSRKKRTMIKNEHRWSIWATEISTNQENSIQQHSKSFVENHVFWRYTALRKIIRENLSQRRWKCYDKKDSILYWIESINYRVWNQARRYQCWLNVFRTIQEE